MDVLAFISILLSYIWVVQPWAAGDDLVGFICIAGALGVAVASLWRRGANPSLLGLRTDNLRTALPVYLLASFAYAGIVLLLLHGVVEVRPMKWPDPGKLLWRLGWAFMQEFCLLAFLLTRLRRLLTGDILAMVTAASLFAFFHLPNPFLTLYTLGGGLVAVWLFRRHPNLVAATVAHVSAATLVAWLLPAEITGRMRVGPTYWLLP